MEISSLSSSSDTTIFLVYGDSAVTTSQESVAGTWGNNYITVHHMAGSSQANQYDSAGSNDMTTEQGNPSYQQTGQIGDAVDLDGNDALAISDDASLDFGSSDSFTLACWVKTSTDANQVLLNKSYDSQEPYYIFRLRSSGEGAEGKTRFYIDDDSDTPIHDGTTSINDGAWHSAVAVRDVGNDKLRIYIDGSEEGTGTTDSTTATLENSLPFGFGATGNNLTGNNLTGLLDECFISSVARDSDWISTAYNNQNDPTPSSTFWSALGSEQGGAVTIVGQMLRGMIG